MSVLATSMSSTLVLASASPRRREIVGALDLVVEVSSAIEGEGLPRAGETAEAYVTRVSLAKANEVASQRPGDVVLAADTAVVLDGDILGKPATDAEATGTLRSLRGRTHRVVTGVAAVKLRSGEARTRTASTVVTMRPYSDEEVAAYVASGEPFDKAGGYAVQDPDFHPASWVEGCYLSVVGLPLCQVMELLSEFDIHASVKAAWLPLDECAQCPLQLPHEAAQS